MYLYKDGKMVNKCNNNISYTVYKVYIYIYIFLPIFPVENVEMNKCFFTFNDE